jgi:proteasome lid subunit RPN8/RPN11
MKKEIKLKENVIKLLIELSKDFYPKQYCCKLLKSGEVINEISILSNLKKNIPELKPARFNIIGPFSYGPYLEQFAVSPDLIFESDFIGFAISHIDESLIPTDNDKQLFAFRGNVHVIIAHPYNNQSWAVYDNNCNKIDIELIE